MSIDINKRYLATMETSAGTIVLELFAKETPKTVNNFVFLAQQGFYDGTSFHRIVKGFMLQGGDPLGNGTGGPGYTFEDEPVTRDYLRGTLAMANAGPNTNGSQFFVVHQNVALPKDYTIFGIVTQGIDVVDKIANTPVTLSPRGEPSKPLEQVVIKRVAIQELPS
ncbi:MAG: peptidylprolyl isomerase [Chloroflexi bacterium]|nr:peptidylprolyl isomerase [Chloroflexota bacterium]